MSKIIPIQNFLKMAPEVPQYSEKNQSYLISGADPLYYLANQSQEEQIAPLAASGYFASTGQSYVGNIVQIIDGGGTGQDVVIATDSGRVYGATLNGTIKKWYLDATVDGGATTDGSQRIALYGGNIVWSSSGSHLYLTSYTGSSWAQVATALSSNTVKYLEPFKVFLVIADGSVVKTMNVSNIISTAFDFGVGYSILRMVNMNNKYIAIVSSQNNGSVKNSFLNLWDGLQPEANYSVSIPGQFIDMIVGTNGILYMLVNESGGQLALYYLSGTILRRSQSIQIDTASLQAWGSGLVYGSVMFNYAGLLGIRLSSKGLLLLGPSDSGSAEFILFPDSQFGGVLYLTNPTTAGSGSVSTIYAATTSLLGYYIPYAGSGVTDGKVASISYQSQWIPVKNLQAIDIWYENPPASTNDRISVTIYGQGENIIAGNSTTVLDNITSTNYLNKKRTRLDLKGFVGDQVMVKLTTNVGSGSSWYPIIRQINLITK